MLEPSAVAEQESCNQQFLRFCEQHCPSLDAEVVWKEFSRALHSAIHVTGANLYHLLADGTLERDVDWLASFLSKFNGEEEKEGLRNVLEAFLHQPIVIAVTRFFGCFLPTSLLRHHN
ncbi:hypothetical protein [Neopusillimonas aromaticivorans]|uniref:hypothetical protein n=1 Tax=Neopusillimonas aromaticivorans TaxID=2979868 RepID=UPI00259A324B|nr:hypothetical protein [Neopusillimonas aromaticivorans]WJJ93756.1 hypothetical protein N7E01_00295 [Neopusillimonas aromaticivorans]